MFSPAASVCNGGSQNLFDIQVDGRAKNNAGWLPASDEARRINISKQM